MMTEWFTARLRVLLLAVMTACVVHILATLSAGSTSQGSVYAKLVPLVPLHRFAVLPPIAPKAQPLPFMAPDVRYAMCRFDTAQGPVSVSARLPGRGWALALYSSLGDNIFTASGQDGQPTDIALELTPIADRFLGLTPEARGQPSEVATSLAIPAGSGMIVVRAPDLGTAYRWESEAVLALAKCTAHPF